MGADVSPNLGLMHYNYCSYIQVLLSHLMYPFTYSTPANSFALRRCRTSRCYSFHNESQPPSPVKFAGLINLSIDPLIGFKVVFDWEMSYTVTIPTRLYKMHIIGDENFRSGTPFTNMDYMITSSNESISALLVICAGNSPVFGVFPSKRPVMRIFDVSFDLRLSKRLSKQWWGW